MFFHLKDTNEEGTFIYIYIIEEYKHLHIYCKGMAWKGKVNSRTKMN